MPENGYCNPVTRSDKSGKGLSHCEDRDDRTCLVQEPDMSSFASWNPATDPDKSRGLSKSEWPGHVWAGGWTCSIFLIGTQSRDQICPVFLESWFGRYFR
jgi:hypothetical protein